MKTDLETRARQQLDRWKDENRLPTISELVILQQYAIKEFISRGEEVATEFLKEVR